MLKILGKNSLPAQQHIFHYVFFTFTVLFVVVNDVVQLLAAKRVECLPGVTGSGCMFNGEGRAASSWSSGSGCLPFNQKSPVTAAAPTTSSSEDEATFDPSDLLFLRARRVLLSNVDVASQSSSRPV